MAKSATSSAHIPGPWYADLVDLIIYAANADHTKIAVVFEQVEPTDDSDVTSATANLIAAAPDLLDLAETFWLVCEERLGLLWDDEKGWRGDDEWRDMVDHFTALQKKCERVIAKAGDQFPDQS